jgi:hypothetical protein
VSTRWWYQRRQASQCNLHEILSDRCWPIPEPLRHLAAIRDFPLYVTTTVDHLLEAALREARGDATSVVFRRGGDAIVNDLPRDFAPGSGPVVFHLFGATSMDPEGFAATEDTLIEFSWALIDQDYAPKRLYDFLRRRTLLLLGCDFPDWLARFLIHALTRRPEAQIGVVFISEHRNGGLHDFLRRKRATVPAPLSPARFVGELFRRWQERNNRQASDNIAQAPAPDKSPGKSKDGAVSIRAWQRARSRKLGVREAKRLGNLKALFANPSNIR